MKSDENYDIYRFVARDIELSVLNKIRYYFVGISERRSFFRKFCADNGIELPIRQDFKNSLPDEYCVVNARIDQLAKIRDSAIVEAWGVYGVFRDRLNARIAYYEAAIANQEQYLCNEKERLSRSRANYKVEKDPQQQIWLQSKIGEIKAKIENQNTELLRLCGVRDELTILCKKNESSWKQQLTLIESKIEDETIKFIKNLGRRVIKKIAFSDFIYAKPDYSDQAKKIIEGVKRAGI